MHIEKENQYVSQLPKDRNLLLVADIGGTNSNFGVVSVHDKEITLLVSVHLKSAGIDDFTQTINDILDHLQKTYGLAPTKASIGVAGVISPAHDFSAPTNLSFSIDAKKIMSETNLSFATLLNDFEAIAYGIDQVPTDYIATIKPPEKRAIAPYFTKAILGAGTGLGKSILIWDCALKRGIPHASEGGHGDASLQDAEEVSLASFIRAKKNYPMAAPISWEDLLSGSGLQNIFEYCGTQKTYTETAISRAIAESGNDPKHISAHREVDPQSKDTFKLFTRFYARCAKNLALDTLALGGVYFSGGIATKNLSIFKSAIFLDEFYRSQKMKHILREIPIHVITNYNINLYGATVFGMIYQDVAACNIR